MRYVLWFVGALAVLISYVPPVAAQAPPEKVRIKTVDGVELTGRFYPGKGETPPVVMLLHGLKENSKNKEWTSLATALQSKGFAVLSFDFRGFGSGTTEVDSTLFWAPQHRLNAMIPGPKDSISSKQFRREYYPALINDIAAAKAFLDRRNDGNAGGARCNSSNTFLIGSREGALLGSIWLNAEWHRYKVRLDPTGRPMIQLNPLNPATAQGAADMSQPAAGAGVIGAVWLSITPKLGGGVPLHLDSILNLPAKKSYVPMALMYGGDDVASKRIARNLEPKLVTYKKLKNAKGQKIPDDKYKYTGTWEIPETKLEGSDLLQESRGTVDKVVEYVDTVVQAKSNEWLEQDFKKSAYVWTANGAVNQPVNPAIPVWSPLIKRPGELYLDFSDYGRFMP